MMAMQRLTDQLFMARQESAESSQQLEHLQKQHEIDVEETSEKQRNFLYQVHVL